ncbi:hypothetical protein LTR94_036312, partial [Friedmanniomyces endolithicus]
GAGTAFQPGPERRHHLSDQSPDQCGLGRAEGAVGRLSADLRLRLRGAGELHPGRRRGGQWPGPAVQLQAPGQSEPLLRERPVLGA